MELLDQIINCERKYTELTSIKDDMISHISFKDNITPDLPMQNFTYITRHASEDSIKRIVNLEIIRLKKENLDYVRFVFDPLLAFSAEIPEFSDFTFNSYNVLILNLDNTEVQFADNNCFPIIDKHKNKITELYRKLNNSCKIDDTHITRWIEIKLNEPNLETIVYSKNGVFLGNCELFFYNNLVKLEDLEVIDIHRSMGLGGALLKSAISIAKSRNKKILYLVADRNDWVADYYIRKGFKHYSEYNSCTLYG